MVKDETLEKIREMLKELGWSDEVVEKYLLETFDTVSKSGSNITAEQ